MNEPEKPSQEPVTVGSECNGMLGADALFDGSQAHLLLAMKMERCNRNLEPKPAAWHTDQGIVVRSDIKEVFGWTGAWVDAGRAYPDSWEPFLYA